MTSILDKLNLRPGERRLVVVVALVVFAVLYFWFIWPQFSEWSRLKKKKTDLEQTLIRYQKEIEKTDTYQKELADLKQKGQAVSSDAQALDMQRTVNSIAAMNGVQINGYTSGKGPSSSGGKTNAWFEEQTGTIQFLSEETALVNFLFALSSGNSLIRVSSMTLNPDPSRMKLMGSMTLVASYPKKPATAKPAGAAAAPAAGPRPGTPATARPPGTPAKSISAAVSATSRPATNAAASPSWWSKVTGFFSSSKTTNAPAKAPAPTNAPVKK